VQSGDGRYALDEPSFGDARRLKAYPLSDGSSSNSNLELNSAGAQVRPIEKQPHNA
jgi:hypothetical protein